ncbi:C4-dicarboxylate ABC transporter permease [Marinococcus halophilus]|uniref:C4-dicarboxylate ABC transporter permease n=1 Tax=Marinococcus halophilus TaxID=1371 RepID=A0A510Y977_MARHA|nr:TRAP transporter large permease [Marinococcus halophilus]OZT79070.1 C4-dicarboxylate ABC transporter permease [Marinococcus halophilus]GEK59946.1 C4-dicarboxylate ABC transporter permease [Marinococcus halophilus]
MSPELLGILGVALLFVFILFRMSVGLSLFIVGFLGVSALTTWDGGLARLGTSMFVTANDYSLSVIPLFVLMGMFLSNTGLGKDLFKAADNWMGHLRGGLAVATVGASSIFSAISGSANATTATLARITIPEMKEYDYKTTFSTAAVAAGGTLGSLIPPSVILLMYGALTSEPIGPLLIAGLIPGILLTILFIILINVQVRLNPEIAPKKESNSAWKKKIFSLKSVWPFLVVFFISIGGIYFGVFTPSEAGGIGAIGAFLLALVTKRLSWKGLSTSLDEAVRLTVMLFLILIGASLFGEFLALSQLPMGLTSFVQTLDVSPYVILAVILLIYFILGMFMEGIAIMVLTLPIVYPMITDLGFDGIWFGIIMVMVTNTALLTPPLGLSVYIISGIVKDVSIERIFKGVMPAVFTMVLFTILLIIFPQIVTYWPSLIQ